MVFYKSVRPGNHESGDAAMIEHSLSGKWQLRNEGLSVSGTAGLDVIKLMQQGWIDAAVPGEVHLDLISAGLMPEPLYSTNAPECRWPEDRSWWYRLNFEVPEAVIAEQQQQLVFEGLDYYAQVFLNGSYIGESENAFIPALFDVTHTLTGGSNELVVRLTAGNERATQQRLGDALEANNFRRNFEGIRELRKPQFSYGWDWVDSLPNIGIWRNVSIHGRSKARLHDIWPRIELSDDHASCKVHVDVDIANLHPWAEGDFAVKLEITAPDGAVLAAAAAADLLPVGISRQRLSFTIANPKLWWPNGYGDQPLYRLRVELESGGMLRDVQQRHIGLRTVAIDRRALPEGHRFAIQVNGCDIFCKGGNWIPADAIPARVSAERYHALVSAARDAHMTMLRVWGGGIYESPEFYDACDRSGILVWQDFMFACATYPDETQAFCDKIRHEAETVVRRLRHHPCIALWCANNENTWAMRSWWNNQKPYPSPNMALGGRHIYSSILPQVCRNLDPDRPYWPGSPAGGEDPNSETEGDCHWWGNATMNPDINRRIRHEIYDECKSRFVSEYGVIGPCHLDSIGQFLKPAEMHVSSKAWKIHTNTFEKETTPAAIRCHYAEPEQLSVAQYIRYGQMFQAMMYGRSIEALRFRKGDAADDCSGALIWMFNDCWGETGWTPIDYYLRRKASYYWIKNACYPVRALIRQRGSELVVRVVNDSLQPYRGVVRFGFVRVDGRENRLQAQQVDVAPNAMLEVARLPIAADVADADCWRRQWIGAAFCEDAALEAIACIWTFVPHRELELPPAAVKVTGNERRITLCSQTYAHGVGCEDGGAPLFSDNYFDLLPGIERTIDWLGAGAVPADLAFSAVASPALSV